MAGSTIKPVIVEPSTQHTATIIFLHGLGDTGHGWADELRSIKPSYAKLICPTARTNPVTINKGMGMPSWFDIRSLDKNDKNQDVEGVKESAQYILDMIKAEIAGDNNNPGIPAGRIVLGGFSQGGALSLYTGLTSPIELGGIVSLSGYLPISDTIKWDTIQKPPIFQCHGDEDSVVAYEYGTRTATALSTRVPKHTFKTYPGMDHCSCAEELSDLEDFLKEVLPPI